MWHRQFGPLQPRQQLINPNGAPPGPPKSAFARGSKRRIAGMKATIICLLCMGLPFSAAAQNTPGNEALCSRQNEFAVIEVIFEDATHLSIQEQAMVKLRLLGHCFNSSNIADSGAIVLEAFQNAGYFRAYVSDPIVRVRDASRSPKPVALVFDTVEGNQYKVREIEWHGVKAFTPEQIQEITPIRVEDTFSKTKVDEFVEGTRNLYRASGYRNVSVKPEIKCLSAGGVQLQFFIDEGPLSLTEPR